MKKLILLLLLLPTLTACEKTFFEDQPKNDPESIFEALWNDFDDHYGPARFRNADFTAVYAEFRPEVGPGMSDDSLWSVCTRMLSRLDDGHVQMVGPGRHYFYANRYYRDKIADSLYDPQLVEQYLDPGFEHNTDWGYTEGMLNGELIYLHLEWVDDNFDRIPAMIDAHPEALGLVLDLRHNGGGDFTYAYNAMGRLTEADRFAYRSRTHNGPGTFTDWHDWYLPAEGPFFDKPIAVLIDRYTISAGERAVLALDAIPGLTLIGDSTNGAISTMIGREMANGWYYTIPTQEIEHAPGLSWEGLGIPPDMRVINDPAEMAAGKDAALEAAIALF